MRQIPKNYSVLVVFSEYSKMGKEYSKKYQERLDKYMEYYFKSKYSLDMDIPTDQKNLGEYLDNYNEEVVDQLIILKAFVLNGKDQSRLEDTQNKYKVLALTFTKYHEKKGVVYKKAWSKLLSPFIKLASQTFCVIGATIHLNSFYHLFLTDASFEVFEFSRWDFIWDSEEFNKLKDKLETEEGENDNHKKIKLEIQEINFDLATVKSTIDDTQEDLGASKMFLEMLASLISDMKVLKIIRGTFFDPKYTLSDIFKTNGIKDVSIEKQKYYP